MREILTTDIDCPWCMAKAGEPCYIQSSNPDRPWDVLRGGVDGKRVHLARCRAVPKPMPDIFNPPTPEKQEEVK